MTYIIIQRPHPLDRLWAGLLEGVYQAFDAADNAPDDPDHPGEVDQIAAGAAYDIAQKRLAEMLAIPARNLEDVLSKLDVIFDEDGERIEGSLRPVLDEFLDLLNAGLAAGREYEQQHGAVQ